MESEVLLDNILDNLPSPPEIEDISWKMDYIQRDSTGTKTKDIEYLIKLQIKDKFSDEKEVQFQCTIAQLTHLIGKLKQITAFLQKYSQS